MSPTDTHTRDYAPLLDRFDPEPRLLPAHQRDARMQTVVDAAWEALSPRAVSWIGFYFKNPRKDEMTLGPRRDKPACSPLGLHGMCGRCWYARKPMIVRDVATLGAGYIACDPRDKSELVIPLFEADGSCYAVLDADSFDTDAFHTADVIGLTTLVEHAGLSQQPATPREIVRL
jgi:putative methionine-R-sulfoxide reductase with GAF domain